MISQVLIERMGPVPFLGYERQETREFSKLLNRDKPREGGCQYEPTCSRESGVCHRGVPAEPEPEGAAAPAGRPGLGPTSIRIGFQRSVIAIRAEPARVIAIQAPATPNALVR